MGLGERKKMGTNIGGKEENVKNGKERKQEKKVKENSPESKRGNKKENGK